MSCILKWHWVYSCCVALLRFVDGLFLILSVVTNTQLQVFHAKAPWRIKIMGSYPLSRAAMQYVGGSARRGSNLVGNLSHPWNHKTSVCTLLFPHSTSYINLWPCLCRVATCFLVGLCLQPAKSLWSGRRGSFCSPELAEGSCSCSHSWWCTMLSFNYLVTSDLVVDFYLKRERADGCFMPHTSQIPGSVFHPGKFSWLFVGWLVRFASFFTSKLYLLMV